MNISLFTFAFVVTMSLASGDRPLRLIPVRITDTRSVIQNNPEATDDNSHDPKPSARFSVEALAAIKAGLIGAGVGGFIGGQVANSAGASAGGGSSGETPTCIITRRRRSLGDYDDDDDNQNYKFTFIADSNVHSRQATLPTPPTTPVSPPGSGTGTGAAINCIIISKGRSAGDRIMSKRTKFIPRRHI